MSRSEDPVLWEDMFPHGFFPGEFLALGADACWPTPGYTSRHGTAHLTCLATGCIVAVAHVTKDGNKKTEDKVLEILSEFLVKEHKGASGAMDQVATALCAEWLMARYPGHFDRVVLCRDGDVKAVRASDLANPKSALWEDARCKCHIKTVGRSFFFLRKPVFTQETTQIQNLAKCDGPVSRPRSLSWT